jgi:xanthine/uracil permease
VGWLASALVALLLVSVLAFVVPSIFGPVVAGIAPLLVVVALIGLGGMWWRRSQHRVDAEVAGDGGDADAEPEALKGEDDRVET